MPKQPATEPHFLFEQGSAGPVAGVDEAGRGPWAGPVVAAAVILDPRAIPAGLNDSKKLSAQKREALFDLIHAHADVGIGIADVARIDRDNILNATLWAMEQAVAALRTAPCLALIDGNRAPKLSCATRTIIGGDGASLSIAAASIIAKVTRDRLMAALDQEFPGFGFARHKGYGTAVHAQALDLLGPCAAHRTSFAPVRAALAKARLS